MMKKIVLLTLLALGGIVNAVQAQFISINSHTTVYSEDFNTLSTSGLAQTVIPNGWWITENTSNPISTAILTYRAGDGSSNTGDTYSFGTGTNTDRAIGSVASGTTQSNFGVRYINNSGMAFTSYTIRFTMEQWRSGGRTSLDSVYFFHAINGNLDSLGYIRINSPSWKRRIEGDLISKVTQATSAGLDGNNALNQQYYELTITGDTINAGDTLYLRWRDPNVAGNDDGLGIDSFSFVVDPTPQPPVAPEPITSISILDITSTSLTLSWAKPGSYIDSSYRTVVFLKSDSAISGNPTEVWASNYTANSDFSGMSSVLANDSFARCVYNGDDAMVQITGLSPSVTYYAVAYTFRETDSLYSTATTQNGTTDGLVPNPKPIASIQVNNIAYETLDLSWTLDSTYLDSVHSVVVFAKLGSAITTGANSALSTDYTASTTLGMGSMYQNDSNAFCIYNGDSTGVSLSGLQQYSDYHFLVYVVRDVDTVYSTATTTSATTLEMAPETVTGITVNGTSQTTARISWIKPAGYENARFTTLAFVKAGTINSGTVNKGVTAYTASTAFGSGSMFDADSQAYCVFKGDTNFVNITSLSSQTQYHVVIFVMRDTDSVESVSADGSGSTQGPPPMYSIGSINTTHPTTGLADSNGVRVTVRGTVYGFNQRVTGLQFLLKDSTGGITLFHASKNFGYTVLEGDRIEAEGLINTFRGLNEITLDTIRFVSSGNPVNAARKVQILSESTENDLIHIDSVRFLTTPANGVWPTASTNIRVITPTNDTVTVRVISTSGLAGKALPTTPTFSIAGIGSQNTTATSAPYPFTGYQMFPRYEGDVTEITVPTVDSLTPFHLLAPANGDTIVITAANLSDLVTIQWSDSKNTNGVDATQYTLWLDTLGGDFGNPYDEVDNGSDTSFTITKQDLKDLILDPLQIPQGGLFAGSWQVTATSGNLVRISEETFTFYLLNDISTGLAEQLLNERIAVSPNPAIGSTRVSGLMANDRVQLMDITGKELFTQQATESTMVVPTLDLNSGIYFVRITNTNGAITRKLVVQ